MFQWMFIQNEAIKDSVNILTLSDNSNFECELQIAQIELSPICKEVMYVCANISTCH